MKKVVLIGASGFVGSAILNEALSRDMEIKAVVRNPDKIKIANANLTIVGADISDAGVVMEILNGVDTVISAYSAGWLNPNIYNETLKVYPQLVECAKKAGVKRMLIVGGAGSLFVAPGVRLMDSGEIPPEVMDGVKSLAEFYLNVLMKEKDVDWVFFSPAALLKSGERTGVYRLGKDDMIVDHNGESMISVQDYAKAMVDELLHPRHHHERFTIGY